MEILYEDSDLIAVNKPSGVLSVPTTGGGKERSAVDLVQDEILRAAIQLGMGSPKRKPLFAVHRLDRDVSGVLIFAKNKPTQDRMMLQFKERKIKKTYLLILEHRFAPNNGTIALAINDNRPKARAIAHQGKMAETTYQVLREENGLAFVRAKTSTGRRHQIRLHFAETFVPLVGDRLYGWKETAALRAFSGIALHGESVSFQHPKSNDKITLNAPLPEIWQAIFKELVVDAGD